MSRERAIEKLEAWARWELGIRKDTGEGQSLKMNPGDISGDQSDYLTVEIALKEFAGPYLKGLLLHVYGHHAFPETYDPFKTLPEAQRGHTQAFLLGYGLKKERFCASRVKAFTRFLGERLTNEVAA